MAAVEVEEAFLLGPDLMDVDVVVAGVGEPLDRRAVRRRIRAADHGRGDVVLRDELGNMLEVPRQLARGLPRHGLVLRSADGQLADPRLVTTAGRFEPGEELCVRRRSDQAVAGGRAELRGIRLPGCDHDRRRLVGEVYRRACSSVQCGPPGIPGP